MEGDFMEIKNILKAEFAKHGWTLTAIIEKLNERNKETGRKDTVSNLSNKMTNNTLRYGEVLDIADVMGYEIVWVPKRE